MTDCIATYIYLHERSLSLSVLIFCQVPHIFLSNSFHYLDIILPSDILIDNSCCIINNKFSRIAGHLIIFLDINKKMEGKILCVYFNTRLILIYRCNHISYLLFEELSIKL